MQGSKFAVYHDPRKKVEYTPDQVGYYSEENLPKRVQDLESEIEKLKSQVKGLENR